MNVVVGLIVGSLIGWAAFAVLRMGARRGLPSSLFLGAMGGGIGMQLALLVTGVPGIESVRDVFSLLMTAATASAWLITASMIESR